MKTELEMMNELYEDMIDEAPERTNIYFTPSEDDLDAMFEDYVKNHPEEF